MWKLRLSMYGTLAIIIGVSTTFFAAILWLFNVTNIIFLIGLVATFNIIQWLLAPYLINAMYKVKEVKPGEAPKLQATVDRLAAKSGIKKPKLGIAKISIPNAFAYGSPIAGNRVAVTQGLLDTLDEGEVEAVLGHEFGHLKHRDVQIMMFVSFLPSLFFILSRYLMLSSFYGRASRDRDNSGALMALIGVVSLVMYFVLLLFTLGLSRLREYYADGHSANVVEGGPRKLSEGLAKIVSKTGRMRRSRQREAIAFNGFKGLFISDPDRAEEESAQIAKYAPALSDQALVEKLLRKKVSSTDRLMEIFSTHPNITKRLRALQMLEVPRREHMIR